MRRRSRARCTRSSFVCSRRNSCLFLDLLLPGSAIPRDQSRVPPQFHPAHRASAHGPGRPGSSWKAQGGCPRLERPPRRGNGLDNIARAGITSSTFVHSTGPSNERDPMREDEGHEAGGLHAPASVRLVKPGGPQRLGAEPCDPCGYTLQPRQGRRPSSIEADSASPTAKSPRPPPRGSPHQPRQPANRALLLPLDQAVYSCIGTCWTGRSAGSTPG